MESSPGSEWMQHTGVVTDVCVDGELPDVEGLDDVRVPFHPVLDVVQHVVHGLGRHVLAHHLTLRKRDRQREFILQGKKENAKITESRRSHEIIQPSLQHKVQGCSIRFTEVDETGRQSLGV